jgi:tetratricopeptide (TPR) repeat protein
MEGFVKIGKTTTDPEIRAKELSSATGVPTQFIVAYKAYFADCTEAESYIHTLLNEKRLSNSKEFFRSSLPDAIQAVIHTEKFFAERSAPNQLIEENRQFISNASETLESNEELWQKILETAFDYYYGLGDKLEDYDEAVKLYKQASKLGCGEASHRVGDMYRNGEGVKEDHKVALQYYKEAVNQGEDICWGDMAILFYEFEEYGNVEKCWDKLFMCPSMKGKEKELALYFIEFMKFMYNMSWFPHKPELNAFYQEMIKGMSEKEVKKLIFGS